MATPSVDNPVRAGAAEANGENVPRQKLREILELYGRPICDEPQRCEALLRDLCVGYRREIFLLVSALRERVVPDIMASLDILPDDVIVSNLVKKLCDNLGLSTEASRWAAESWMLVIRDAPPVGKIRKSQSPPAQRSRNGAAVQGEGAGTSATRASARMRIDWPWMGFCFIAIVSSLAVLAVVMRISLYSNWISFLGWLEETGILAGGLALGWAGEFFAARKFLSREPPHHSVLDPLKTPAALLVEVLVLLTQPLVPIGALALWIAGWLGGLHLVGQNHDLAFNLGRLIQSVPVGFFVFKWAGLMTTIQGRISSSMVRQR